MNKTSTPQVCDADTWAGVRRGDPDALEWLCETWLPVTLQWCRRLGGPRVDADHAAQDVFIVVLRKVRTVARSEQLPSWLFAVTRRVLAQHRRKAWVNRWDPDATSDHRPGVPQPDEIAGRQQTAVKVQQMLMDLPDDLREVLVLCDIEEHTDPEAASILDIPVGTAKSRLRRARTAFRDLALERGLVSSGES